jgi:DNA-binding response OmpR family regulator
LGDHAWQAHTLGADEFLAKPVSIRILVETVARLLVRGGRQEQGSRTQTAEGRGEAET